MIAEKTMPVPVEMPHTLYQRGNVAVEDKGKIVQTYHIGKSTVHIMDTYFAQSQDEIEKVLDDMHEVGWLIAQEGGEGVGVE